MVQLNDLKIMNETMMAYLKKIGMNNQKNEFIQEIFKDEACFFKMDKDDAYLILHNIGIKENIDTIYSELISNDVFYDLYKRGKIQENDKELVIKYKIYDVNKLFKENKINNEEFEKDIAIMNDKKTFFSRILDLIRHFLKCNR